MHGYRRGKLSEYGIRLREKQKLKRFYGVLERQFRRYFELATALAGEHRRGAALSILERRLDNVVHRLGFAPSRGRARQLVAHGHVLVNGQQCDIPSMLVKAGDTIKVKSRAAAACKLVKLNAAGRAPPPIPDFLEADQRRAARRAA